MKKIKSEAEIIQKEFARRFSTWDIPVEQLTITLGKLSNEEEQSHYLELDEILNKKAFHREIDDWKRRIARTLALGATSRGPLSELEAQGLRQTMIEVESFVEMLTKRANLKQNLKPLRARSEKV